MLARARSFRQVFACCTIFWMGHIVDAQDVTAETLSQETTNRVDQTVVLEYRFQPGQFVYYNVNEQVRYVTQQAGINVVTQQTNDSSKHFRVVSVDDEGNALLEPVIDRIKMLAQFADQPVVEYDSTKNDIVPSQFQRHQEAVGRSLARFRHSRDGKLLAVQVIDGNLPQSIADAAAKTDPKLSFLSPLPSGPIAVGHRWKEKYDEKTSAGKGLTQQIPMMRQYEFKSLVNGVATITFKTSILALITDPEIQGRLAQQTPSGTIEFDVHRGLIQSRKLTTSAKIINAFGPQSLLEVAGESNETLVSSELAGQKVGFSQESSEKK